MLPLSERDYQPSPCEGEFLVAVRRHLFSFSVLGSAHIFTPCLRRVVRSQFHMFFISYHKAQEAPGIFVYNFAAAIWGLTSNRVIFAEDKTALVRVPSLLYIKLRLMKKEY
jgi:hypothetical protein